MRLLKLFDRMFRGGGADDDLAHTIDHAPVAADQKAAKLHAKKLKDAARRHGRIFRTHERVTRQAEPSDLLRKLDAKSRQRSAPQNVAAIAGRRKP